ncbi:MAG TPA: c-type cytochrome [Steroidobacteraceae bacterium]|nr:c-type cytochrome [Steroidobacteraceae bacterium]
MRRLRKCGRSVRIGAALVAILQGSVALAAAPDAEGLADACTSCHGIGGHSQGYIPSLAGADRATLLRELQAFRAQTGPATTTIMNRIARAYTDAELEALADYFSARPRL